MLRLITVLITGLAIGWFAGSFGRNISLHGPNSNEIKKAVFVQNGKYFKFIPKPYVCPIRLKKYQ